MYHPEGKEKGKFKECTGVSDSPYLFDDTVSCSSVAPVEKSEFRLRGQTEREKSRAGRERGRKGEIELERQRGGVVVRGFGVSCGRRGSWVCRRTGVFSVCCLVYQRVRPWRGPLDTCTGV